MTGARSPGTSELARLVQGGAEAAGLTAYLVGGSVRDRLLGRDTEDTDVAVPSRAIPLAREIAEASQGVLVVLDERRDMARVVWAGPPARHLDITAFAGATIEADLRARDFSINALAVPIDRAAAFGPRDVVDPTGGLADLGARRLRMTSPEAFQADPVRLLRAVRLVAELDLGLDASTAEAVRHFAGLITRPAAERVRDELVRIVAAPGAAGWVAMLAELGLLAFTLPELAACDGVAQSPPHDRDVLGHSLAVLEAAEWLQRAIEGNDLEPLPRSWDPLLARFRLQLQSWGASGGSDGHGRWATFRLGALLHDIGKPATRTVEASGRIRFLGHETVGAQDCLAVAARLRLSHRDSSYLAELTRWHLRPAALAREGPPSRRAVYRYFRDTGEQGVDVVLLALADACGKALLPAEEASQLGNTAEALWSAWFEKPAERVRPVPVLRGEELMGELGIEPGPAVGRLLAAIAEAQAAGEVQDADGALALARRLAAGRRPSSDP